jgi:YbbR domain-containing protein
MIKRLLRRIFVKNWGLKVFSVLLAVVLWLALIPEEKVSIEKTLAVALEAFNIPSNAELVEKPVAVVDVTIRAPNRLINQITASNPSVLLNLESATIYQEDYPLNPSMINLPMGAEVVRIFPNRVHLKLEVSKAAMLEVAPTVIRESLRDGYRLDKVEVTPGQILVKGPRSKLNDRDKVRTVPIDLAPYTQTTELQADLILPRPDLRLASNLTRVRVRLVITPLKPAAPRQAERH